MTSPQNNKPSTTAVTAGLLALAALILSFFSITLLPALGFFSITLAVTAVVLSVLSLRE